jgi:hypothetical protein
VERRDHRNSCGLGTAYDKANLKEISMADMERGGIVAQSHTGNNNYGFRLDGDEQWYVLDSAMQALKVEFSKSNGEAISFLADDDLTIMFRGNNAYWAHDFD